MARLIYSVHGSVRHTTQYATFIRRSSNVRLGWLATHNEPFDSIMLLITILIALYINNFLQTATKWNFVLLRNWNSCDRWRVSFRIWTSLAQIPGIEISNWLAIGGQYFDAWLVMVLGIFLSVSNSWWLSVMICGSALWVNFKRAIWLLLSKSCPNYASRLSCSISPMTVATRQARILLAQHSYWLFASGLVSFAFFANCHLFLDPFFDFCLLCIFARLHSTESVSDWVTVASTRQTESSIDPLSHWNYWKLTPFINGSIYSWNLLAADLAAIAMVTIYCLLQHCYWFDFNLFLIATSFLAVFSLVQGHWLVKMQK